MMRLQALATALAAACLAVSSAHAACECGYTDPLTLAVWTDASITYFNESGVDDVVLPIKSPELYGSKSAGDTGDGNEQWAVVGDKVMDWEDSFGATYRTAMSYNNTYITDRALGLAMQVSPANEREHIVNGSGLVSRRRDMQFGTFRTMIARPERGGGMGFKWAVAWNQSETIDTTLYMADQIQNETVRLSFSATRQDSDPIMVNQTWFNKTGPLEHRMDWLGPKLLEFRTNGNNDSTNLYSYQLDRNATNLPTTPAPMSFYAWSNGEPSETKGPPMQDALVTHILYVRSFFNSSLPERQLSFTQQCAVATNEDRFCSTDDLTLRNSTAFTLAATTKAAKPKDNFVPPIWAAVPTAACTAVFIAVIIHAILLNRRTDKATRLAKMQQEIAERDTEPRRSMESQATSRKHLIASSSRGTLGGNKALLSSVSHNEEEALDLPELYSDWDDSDIDDDDYDSEDIEDVEQLGPEFGGRRHSRRRASTMPRDAVEAAAIDPYGGQSDFLAEPPAAFNKSESYRYGASKEAGDLSEARGASPAIVQTGFANPFSYGGAATASGSPPRTGGTQPFHMRPTIIHWKGRHDADVGRLAEPIGSARMSHRLSVAPVQTSVFSIMFSRVRNAIFIGSADGPRTSTGERRIDYLDGMRGFACLGVSVGHFFLMFYPGVSNNAAPQHYPGLEFWLRIIVGPPLLNAGLLLGIFFLLPARTMCQRYLLKGGLSSMADSTIRRLPRLILPVLGACLANYFLIDLDAYKWVRRLASRTWSSWAYYQNYENVLVFTNAFITLWWASPPDDPALVTGYATGVLWTIPLIVQGLWTCMLCALVAHEIPKAWKRFTFYFICVACSWYANTWDLFFMGGLIIADLDANIQYRQLAAHGIPIYFLPKKRLHGKWLAWLFFLACCVQQWIQYIPTAPRAGTDLSMKEKGVKPDLLTSSQYIEDPATLVYRYQDPQVFAWLWVMSMFILADVSNGFQTIWRLRIWRWFGKHAMAFYLCHGIIFWTWGAWCCLALLAADVPYWAAVLVTFITSYILLSLGAIAFTATFEHWAMLLSKSVWRAASGHYGRKI